MPSTRPRKRTVAPALTPAAPASARLQVGAIAAQAAAYSPVGLLAVDRACRIVYVSGAALHLLGATEQQAHGQRICDLLAPHEGLSPDQWCPSHRLFAGQERRREPRETIVRLGDERRAVLMAVGPLGDAAAPDGAVVSIIPVQHEGALQEQRRHLVARLLHDLRTPLSGIGVAAELLDPGAAETPAGIVDALRMHHADLLRYVSELADFTLLDLDARLPTAQPLSLDDAFEAVLWRLSLHLQRREQTLRVDNAVTRPVMLAQQYLEQALMAVVFDVSTYATSRTTLAIRAREHGQHATIAIEGRGGALGAEEVGALTDPYLRVRPGAHTSGLMSLAATKHALVYYGGTLQVVATRTRLCISLSLPLAHTP